MTGTRAPEAGDRAAGSKLPHTEGRARPPLEMADPALDGEEAEGPVSAPQGVYTERGLLSGL